MNWRLLNPEKTDGLQNFWCRETEQKKKADETRSDHWSQVRTKADKFGCI